MNMNTKHTLVPVDSSIRAVLKIMSWNIQSSSSIIGNKFDDALFIDNFKNHDIVCLQETRQSVQMNNYRAICSLRPGARSGGVAILYKNGLIGGVDQIKNKNKGNNDIVICKLKKSFFKLNQDIYIINAYIKPVSSSGRDKSVDGRETLKQLEEIVNELQGSGEIILCGDFNARIGDCPGLIDHDDNNHIPLPDDYIPDTFTPRLSHDKQTNAFGKDFLRLVVNNRLTILNGRTLGDFNGALTSIQVHGCSVIDYFAVSSLIHKSVNYMIVLNFTQFSDHKPLSLELSMSQFHMQIHAPLESTYELAPNRFIFNDESKCLFTDIQLDNNFSNKLSGLTSQLDSIYTDRNNNIETQQKISDLNIDFTNYLCGMASQCSKMTKASKKKKRPNNPWFNSHCQSAKRQMKRAARATSNFPNSVFLRENYYKVKKTYKVLVKHSKNKFFNQLNKDIEGGKVLNWQQFKRLKSHKSDKLKFDSVDMNNFENFFKQLYADDHSTIDSETKQAYIVEADIINTTNHTTSSTTLNDLISYDEVTKTIKSLKTGKASSIDMISNEIIRSLDINNVMFLTKLFNLCLDSGSYPWNVSIISPLHKKGSKDNPDNYRAIAVSSVIGKLFSTILLDRLIKFRDDNCPDPPNQLGFTKKAQTYDHILTMQTIAAKYKKLHNNVYAVFVDFKKAFDSVCRQALFLKLANKGVTGKFYDVLRSMYSNSVAHIKLSGYLSRQIDIRKGTEQGHPLSPDLFKIFLSDLSDLLDFQNCPHLSGLLVSHLLWADDLILLSLDPKTAQLQLNKLAEFCTEWGIEINESKTKSVIFGKSPNRIPILKLNGNPLEIVDSYCYLGIIIHKTGSMKEAKVSLRNKAMRSFFGLKRTVNRSKLSFRALTTLFDSLIKPIVLYGAPIWTPTCPIIKTLSRALQSKSPDVANVISKINRTVSEKVHLTYLKWALGVHRKSSNVGTWGECGRYPLIYQSIKLTLNYYRRVMSLKPNCLVKAALLEQRNLKLPWYKGVESLLKLDELYSLDHVTGAKFLKACARGGTGANTDINHFNLILNRPHKIKCLASQKMMQELSTLKKAQPIQCKKFRVNTIYKNLVNHFKECWDFEKRNSAKLTYYSAIKVGFGKEPYLDSVSHASHRFRTTKLRISAHDLEIEEGRYLNIPREERICKWCNISLSKKVVENETHVLYDCDLYGDLRNKMVKSLNQAPCHTTGTTTTRPTGTITSTSLKRNHSFMKLLSPQSPNYSPDHLCNCYCNGKSHDDPAHAIATTHGTNNIDGDGLNESMSIPNCICQSLNIWSADHSPQHTTIANSQMQNINILRPYILNTLCAFIGRCFEKRWAFIGDTKSKRKQLKSLFITIVR